MSPETYPNRRLSDSSPQHIVLLTEKNGGWLYFRLTATLDKSYLQIISGLNPGIAAFESVLPNHR